MRIYTGIKLTNPTAIKEFQKRYKKEILIVQKELKKFLKLLKGELNE